MNTVIVMPLSTDGSVGTNKCDIRIEALAEEAGFSVCGQGYSYRNHRHVAYPIAIANFATREEAMEFAGSVYCECIDELGFCAGQEQLSSDGIGR